MCCFPFLAHPQELEDSVIVIKGQVSDYYITVKKKKKFRSGHVTGSDGKPLEGATVMFQYSPVHANTDEKGMYRIMDGGYDSVLVVYYPQNGNGILECKGHGKYRECKIDSAEADSCPSRKGTVHSLV